MAINIEVGLSAIQKYVNNSRYSMYGSRFYTDGTCDCSGAVYWMLRQSGGYNYGYIPSTETLHDYLTKLGYAKIAENTDFPMQRGDVIIWGRKGYSAGAGGHTGIALDNQNWVECTAWKNSTIIANHDQRWVMAGCPYFYAYRLKTQSNKPNPTPSKPSTSAPTQIKKTKEGNVMLLFKDKKNVYWLVGNQYTYVKNPADLYQIKIMMQKAGYDTWEHTNDDQIKYIKKIATEKK